MRSQTEAINTTPDACLLQKMLAEYLKQGAKAVAMEVSPHGLEQGRVNGVHFKVAVLTNLSQRSFGLSQIHGGLCCYQEKIVYLGWFKRS